MGAVAAFDGTITVTSGGHRQTLAIDNITGKTHVASDTVTRPVDGTTVEITLPSFTGDELDPAKLALTVAHGGTHYSGPSQPDWYGSEDLRELFARVTPPTTTVTRIVRDVFALKIEDDRIAADLTAAEVAQLIDFIEAKFAKHNDVTNVVPPREVVEQHARRLLEQRLAHEAPTRCAKGWPGRRRHTSCRAIWTAAKSASSLPSAPSFRGIGRWRRCCVSDNGPTLGQSVPEDAQGHALGLVPPHGLDDAPGGPKTGASCFRRYAFAGRGWTCRRRREVAP
jgi:hypothetical protein